MAANIVNQIHHVGMAVRDLDEAIDFLKRVFGAEVIERQEFPDQKLESAMVSVGKSTFELSQSTDPQGLIAKFIESRGPGLHHISLEVEDMDAALKHFKENGLMVVGEMKIEKTRVAFLRPEGLLGILFEIFPPLILWGG